MAQPRQGLFASAGYLRLWAARGQVERPDRVAVRQAFPGRNQMLELDLLVVLDSCLILTTADLLSISRLWFSIRAAFGIVVIEVW